jgi:hypothetical protein
MKKKRRVLARRKRPRAELVLRLIFSLCDLSGLAKKKRDHLLDKTREFIQLLATLAATVAYQAGVDPPGGVWADSGRAVP